MKLDVISTRSDPARPDPWYADGLQFTCQQCGNCCTGGPGYVWVSEIEIARLAEYLKITTQEVLKQYCRKVHGRISLKEIRTQAGQYDCIFLTENKPGAGDRSRVKQSTRGCSIYPVRPLQCRTWPFWDGLLRDPSAWNEAGKGCHGINRGRKFTLDEIAQLRDAKDWPENPPTSDGTTDEHR